MKKKNTITLQTAKKWAKNWRELESDYNKYHECRAFNIPKIDFQEVLAEEGVESVRAYLGVKETKDKKKIYFPSINTFYNDNIASLFLFSVVS